VKELRSELIDTTRREKGTVDIQDVDELTGRSFYKGLPIEYKILIDASLQTKSFALFAAAQDAANMHEQARARTGQTYN